MKRKWTPRIKSASTLITYKGLSLEVSYSEPLNIQIRRDGENVTDYLSDEDIEAIDALAQASLDNYCHYAIGA